jgi:hypothetical protein
MPTTDRTDGSDADQRRVADRYLLRRRIGVGGMGIVWEALDELLARRVAIKAVELPSTLVGAERAKFAARVLREARAAARLTHPAAVTLYDVIREQGTTYIVMELVEARSLATLVQEDGPLQPEEAARIGLQVLAALEVAHGHGIVHRDVKPGNVLVLPGGQAKLTDFGIATLRGDPELTATGMVLGSPGYMSPEQASGEGSGPASDLYGLGATLYYAVEGQAPFGKAAPIPTMAAVVHEEPRPLRRAGPLGPIIERLLAKDPEARPIGVEVRRFLDQVAAAGAAPSRGAATAVPVEREAPGEQDPATLEELPVPVPVPVPAREPEPEAQEAPERADEPEPQTPRAPAGEPEPREPRTPPPTPREPERVPVPAPVPATVEREPERPAGEPAGPSGARRGLLPLPVIGALLLLATAIGLMAAVATRDGGGRPSAAGGTAPTTAAAGTRGDGAGTGGGGAASTSTTRQPTTTAGEAPTTAAPEGGGAPPRDGGTPAGWRTFTAPSGVYQLAYPGDWTIRRGRERIVDFVRPGGGAYLRVDWTDQPQDPWENWKTYEPQFAASHAGYQRLRLEPGTFNGLRAALWEYRYRSGGTTLHAVNHTFVSRDGRFAYAFNFQTRDADWGASAGLLRELQRQFRVRGSDGS